MVVGVVEGVREQHPGREVVLVSKDINMRVKARALGLPAEDYQNDKALEDTEIDTAMQAVLEQLKQSVGARLR